MEEQNREKAISYSLASLEIARKEGLKEQIRDASYLLFLLHQEAGEFEKANRYQTQYHAYKDSIQNLEATQKLADLRTQFEVGLKQAEVDLLLAQKRSNQIIITTGSIMLVIVISLAILLFSYSKAKTRLNMQLQEQKDSLISLNNTKDKFFSIISHDLRGPVGVLNGLIYVIRKEVENLNTPELKEILDRMEHSASHLVNLLDNLLHWALQQRGQFPYSPEHLGIGTILLPVADLFKDMASSKNIKLEMQVEENFTVLADKNATSTIFRNLLNNAIKFTPEGGHIRVIAEKKGRAEAGTIRFIDSGVGIPQEKLKKLFNLNEATSTKGTSGESGLGLGLQLVSELVQLHKGKIEVESEVGKGTTFSIHLPLSNQ
jgi:signal transduction histidine kinase